MIGSTLSKYFGEQVIQGATLDIGVTDEILPTQSGLALLGLLLSKANLTKKLNWLPTKTGIQPKIRNSEVAKSYISLLVQGKSNFEDIEPFRGDPFFKKSLDFEKAPSSSTLRQRLDKAENKWKGIVLTESARLIKRSRLEITPTRESNKALPGPRNLRAVPLGDQGGTGSGEVTFRLLRDKRFGSPSGRL